MIITEFITENDIRGTVIELGAKELFACTDTTIKRYKTMRGAVAFMVKNGFKETDTIGTNVLVNNIDMKIVRMGENLNGLPKAVENCPTIKHDIEMYLLGLKRDRWDLLDAINRELEQVGADTFIIDDMYEFNRELVSREGIRLGSVVKGKNIKGEATVIGIMFHRFLQSHVVALSNGDVDPTTELVLVKKDRVDICKGDTVKFQLGDTERTATVDNIYTQNTKQLIRVIDEYNRDFLIVPEVIIKTTKAKEYHKPIYYRGCTECGRSVTEAEFEENDGMCPDCYNEYYKEAISKGMVKSRHWK